MEIVDLEIPGLKLIHPRRFGDQRGFFSEVYNRAALAEAGIATEFIQDNHSMSEREGTVRGLHFQRPPVTQAKLVRVARGRILDVAVDLRQGSPTFRRHVAVELSAQNWSQLLVPAGFAHGFCTLEPDTEVLYKVSAPYAPALDGGVIWNDPDLGIDWPVDASAAVLSEKDLRLPRLRDIAVPF